MQLSQQEQEVYETYHAMVRQAQHPLRGRLHEATSEEIAQARAGVRSALNWLTAMPRAEDARRLADGLASRASARTYP